MLIQEKSLRSAAPKVVVATTVALSFKDSPTKEIAARLDISEGAVKASLRLLFEKLKVRTRAQLVKVALEQYRDQL